MELKHKECFIPAMINYYDLQGVSKYAREAAEFVNLYSKSRGINRFPALIETLEWLAAAAGGQGARASKIQIPPGLVRLDEARDEAGQSGAGAEAVKTDRRPGPEADPGLVRGGERGDRARWSAACRRFPCVRESLERSAGRADVLVVSATPQEALHREWDEHDLDALRAWRSAARRCGTKKELLAMAREVSAATTR